MLGMKLMIVLFSLFVAEEGSRERTEYHHQAIEASGPFLMAVLACSQFCFLLSTCIGSFCSVL